MQLLTNYGFWVEYPFKSEHTLKDSKINDLKDLLRQKDVIIEEESDKQAKEISSLTTKLEEKETAETQYRLEISSSKNFIADQEKSLITYQDQLSESNRKLAATAEQNTILSRNVEEKDKTIQKYFDKLTSLME